MLTVHMIGNAHLDPVWLWRWQQGADEALATFRSAADRCDEYPEFCYTRGEAWLYRLVERLDPALFARIRLLIARGQWHITGGQVIQPDANLPTTMGWQRQLRHGQRYFMDRFGIRPTIAYNVDSFGHPATTRHLSGGGPCRIHFSSAHATPGKTPRQRFSLARPSRRRSARHAHCPRICHLWC